MIKFTKLAQFMQKKNFYVYFFSAVFCILRMILIYVQKTFSIFLAQQLLIFVNFYFTVSKKMSENRQNVRFFISQFILN